MRTPRRPSTVPAPEGGGDRGACSPAGPERWQQCWWGRGRSPCRPVRRPPRAVPGADVHGRTGAGDPYFPFAGNGGYDVRHYDLDLTYTPPAPAPAPLVGQLSVATIDLVAKHGLDRFNLDLRGLDVQAITVNGKPASEVRARCRGRGRGRGLLAGAGRRGPHLGATIQPRPKIKQGQMARVVVTYGGATTRPEDIEGALYGWVTMRDGAMVVNEPEGSMTWYLVSDHQTDKATYGFEITVPEGKVAVANGLPAHDPVTEGGWTTWFWDAPDPQASYLTTASVGDYDLRFSETAGGLPIIDAVDDNLTPANAAATEASLELQAEMIAFEETFVPYPFNSAGAIVDDDTVGYALETQTRPVYSRVARESTVAHEFAHQWFGNAVVRSGGRTSGSTRAGPPTSSGCGARTEAATRPRRASTPSWRSQLTTRSGTWPSRPVRFHGAVYDRGAATLHALRVKVGDETFFAASQEWLTRYDDSTATTDDFEAIFEEVSGQDLTTFFDVGAHAEQAHDLVTPRRSPGGAPISDEGVFARREALPAALGVRFHGEMGAAVGMTSDEVSRHMQKLRAGSGRRSGGTAGATSGPHEGHRTSRNEPN